MRVGRRLGQVSRTFFSTNASNDLIQFGMHYIYKITEQDPTKCYRNKNKSTLISTSSSTSLTPRPESLSLFNPMGEKCRACLL